MDLYCERCGEPWDAYGVRHGDLDDEERCRFLAGQGCPACFGKEPCDRSEDCEDCPEAGLTEHGFLLRCRVDKTKKLTRRPFRAQLASALHEVLGGDIDGIAAELQGAEWLMGKDFWR